MNTFIINSWRGVVAQKKKLDVTSKLVGREWLMLSDDPSVSAKYIFLKDGKLLISVNGVSTYSTWQLATESSIILDEGIATFLYQVVHLDDNVVVLNLDGTQNSCFLINSSSHSIEGTFEAIQWYLFRTCNIDILTDDQKNINNERYKKELYAKSIKDEEANDDDLLFTIMLIVGLILCGVVFCFILGDYH